MAIDNSKMLTEAGLKHVGACKGVNYRLGFEPIVGSHEPALPEPVILESHSEEPAGAGRFQEVDPSQSVLGRSRFGLGIPREADRLDRLHIGYVGATDASVKQLKSLKSLHETGHPGTWHH